MSPFLLFLLLPLVLGFVSFDVRTRPAAARSMFEYDEDIQPPLVSFMDALSGSLQVMKGADVPPFLKLVLTDNKQILDSEDQKIKDVKLISARLVNLQAKGLRVQVTYKYITNDQVKNYQFTEIVEEIENYLENGFRRAILTTR